MRRRLRDDRGQSFAFVAIGLTALVGMTAFVVDVGAWFRADRQLQSVADAAALAGAQALPYDPAKALLLAQDYAKKNGGPTAESMTLQKEFVTNDTLAVTYSDKIPGFFAKILGVDTVTVRATAKARASTPKGARWVAPIVVSEKHPLLGCTAPGKCNPVFDVETVLMLDNLKDPGGPTAAGAFGLLNLVKGDSSGTVGASDLAAWLAKGYDQTMTPGTYYSVPSAMFNSSDFQAALADKIKTGDEVLFPIYRKIIKQGSNAEYTIVGWVGFVITGMIGTGSTSTITGHFTQVVWDGLPADDASSGTPDYGVHVVSLTG
jgi:Flp pilus assembly protein TadG